MSNELEHLKQAMQSTETDCERKIGLLEQEKNAEVISKDLETSEARADYETLEKVLKLMRTKLEGYEVERLAEEAQRQAVEKARSELPTR